MSEHRMQKNTLGRGRGRQNKTDGPGERSNPLDESDCMSDQRTQKKIFGRGRGKPSRSEGPWTRSKKFDDTHQDFRPPKKDGDDFVLNESSFPPLPGAATIDEQYNDKAEAREFSQVNGGVTPGQFEEGKSMHEETNQKDKSSPEKQHRNTDKGKVDEENSMHDTKNQKDESPPEQQTRNTDKAESEEYLYNGNLEGEPTTSHQRIDNQRAMVDITNSNLSPFAEEFVPKGLNMNPDAEDFVPTSPNCDEANNNRASASKINVNDTEAVLADLEETVAFCHTKLMETPGSYDELIGVVTPHFVKYMENAELPSQIVQILYNYAIQDAKFSYFAIKILIHLIRETTIDDNVQLRDAVLRHMQDQVKQVQLTDPNISSASEIHPFLTFLSELYIQLEVAGSRLILIGQALVGTLKKLLTTTGIPIKERLKLIVNILKLTGLFLDQDNPTVLDDLFRDLRVILEQEMSNLDHPTVQVVNDIIILRDLKWGLVEPVYEEYVESFGGDDSDPTNGNAYSYPTNYQPYDESNMDYGTGVFYGPDGNPIDYEEQLFLEVETNALNHLQIGEQSEPSPTSVEGFDEAYEEFLKTVPETKGYPRE